MKNAMYAYPYRASLSRCAENRICALWKANARRKRLGIWIIRPILSLRIRPITAGGAAEVFLRLHRLSMRTAMSFPPGTIRRRTAICRIFLQLHRVRQFRLLPLCRRLRRLQILLQARRRFPHQVCRPILRDKIKTVDKNLLLIDKGRFFVFSEAFLLCGVVPLCLSIFRLLQCRPFPIKKEPHRGSFFIKHFYFTGSRIIVPPARPSPMLSHSWESNVLSFLP